VYFIIHREFQGQIQQKKHPAYRVFFVLAKNYFLRNITFRTKGKTKSMNGKVIAIFISPVAGEPMQQVEQVRAITGEGLEGDRYCYARGTFSKLVKGNRQIALIGARSFTDSGFEFAESRRNIVTEDVELMWLIGREFTIGNVRMKGLKYCDPCNRPSKLSGKEKSFKEAFFDRGGLIAEILDGGLIKTGDSVIPPSKNY
jgi:MOSC domain-containing protein YiiM